MKNNLSSLSKILMLLPLGWMILELVVRFG